ncbi:MAG: RidA family protein [Chloroflexaceae bacterium]|nr:RidA family protein [Chloroflexaceae bacterium]
MSSRTVIHTSNAPEPVGPYSQAIRTDSLVFLAGQVALDPATGELIDGDVQAQTRQVLENLKAVLAQAGSALERVVKTTVFLADIADFAAMNAIYGEYFTNEPPARSAFQVAALPKGARVEIEVIALLK